MAALPGVRTGSAAVHRTAAFEFRVLSLEKQKHPMWGVFAFWCGQQDSLHLRPKWAQIRVLTGVRTGSAAIHRIAAFEFRVLSAPKKSTPQGSALFLVRATGLEPARFRIGT